MSGASNRQRVNFRGGGEKAMRGAGEAGGCRGADSVLAGTWGTRGSETRIIALHQQVEEGTVAPPLFLRGLNGRSASSGLVY